MSVRKRRRDREKERKVLLGDLHAVRSGEKPPIDHKDFGGRELAEVAAVQGGVHQMTLESVELPRDSSTAPSFWSYPAASVMLVFLIVAVVWAAVMTVIQFA